MDIPEFSPELEYAGTVWLGSTAFPASGPGRGVCCNLPLGNPVEPDGPDSIYAYARPGRQSAMADPALKWAVGKELLVYFLEPPTDPWVRTIHAAVRRIAPTWSQYANVKFTFTDNPAAHITVNCLPRPGVGYGAYSSYLGADSARVVASGKPSMHLVFSPALAANPDRQESEFQRVILHEFGHALGFVHEHMRPDRPITWDVAALRRYCATYFGWGAQMVQDQIVATYQPRDPRVGLLASGFDPLSIMMYQYPRGVATYADGTPFSTPNNIALSARDKVVASMLYPAVGVGLLAEWPLPTNSVTRTTRMNVPGQVARFRLATGNKGTYRVETAGAPVLLSVSAREKDPAGTMIAAEGQGASIAFSPLAPGSTYFVEVRMAKPMIQAGTFSIKATGP